MTGARTSRAGKTGAGTSRARRRRRRALPAGVAAVLLAALFCACLWLSGEEPGEEPGAERAAAAKTEEAAFLYVADGDTIVVELDGEKEYVRFLFVNAPESVHPDEEKNNRYGEEASAHAKRLFEGVETVYLEYEDEENNRDRYGRLLAFVWLEPTQGAEADDMRRSLANAAMVADGYAFLHVYDNGNPVNEAYLSVFSELFEEARAENAGLWAEEGFEALYEEQE